MDVDNAVLVSCPSEMGIFGEPVDRFEDSSFSLGDIFGEDFSGISSASYGCGFEDSHLRRFPSKIPFSLSTGFFEYINKLERKRDEDSQCQGTSHRGRNPRSRRIGGGKGSRDRPGKVLKHA